MLAAAVTERERERGRGKRAKRSLEHSRAKTAASAASPIRMYDYTDKLAPLLGRGRSFICGRNNRISLIALPTCRRSSDSLEVTEAESIGLRGGGKARRDNIAASASVNRLLEWS